MDNENKANLLEQRLGGARDTLYGYSSDLPRVIEIEMARIRPNPDQPRRTFNEESLQELANSIETHGLIQPIVVTKDTENGERYLLVAGERRYRAHGLLQKPTIAAIVTSGNPDEIALIENIQREDLSPLDEAEAYARMIERYEYTHEALAKTIGKARNTITEILRINDLPQRIKDECRAPDISVSKTVLIELSRVDDENKQLSLWEEVRNGKVTSRAARQKKSQSSSREPIPLEQKAVSAGRTFVRSLEALTNTPFQRENNATFRELVSLRSKIDEIINSVPQTITETDGETTIKY